jgi:hypothetical protein
MDWVQNPIKSHRGGSAIWKAVSKSFFVVEDLLAWNIGNGQALRVGEDPWFGSARRHILSGELITSLQDIVITYLSQLVVQDRIHPWNQSWVDAESLAISVVERVELRSYYRALIQSKIHIRDRDDCLVWEGAPNGLYTPKDGFISLSHFMNPRDLVGWWKSISKINCPLKHRLFMWNVLENTIPTWDFL